MRPTTPLIKPGDETFTISARYVYAELDADIPKAFDGNLNWNMNGVSVYAKLLF